MITVVYRIEQATTHSDATLFNVDTPYFTGYNTPPVGVSGPKNGAGGGAYGINLKSYVNWR